LIHSTSIRFLAPLHQDGIAAAVVHRDDYLRQQAALMEGTATRIRRRNKAIFFLL